MVGMGYLAKDTTPSTQGVLIPPHTFFPPDPWADPFV